MNTNIKKSTLTYLVTLLAITSFAQNSMSLHSLIGKDKNEGLLSINTFIENNNWPIIDVNESVISGYDDNGSPNALKNQKSTMLDLDSFGKVYVNENHLGIIEKIGFYTSNYQIIKNSSKWFGLKKIPLLQKKAGWEVRQLNNVICKIDSASDYLSFILQKKLTESAPFVNSDISSLNIKSEFSTFIGSALNSISSIAKILYKDLPTYSSYDDKFDNISYKYFLSNGSEITFSNDSRGRKSLDISNPNPIILNTFLKLSELKNMEFICMNNQSVKFYRKNNLRIQKTNSYISICLYPNDNDTANMIYYGNVLNYFQLIEMCARFDDDETLYKYMKNYYFTLDNGISFRAKTNKGHDIIYWCVAKPDANIDNGGWQATIDASVEDAFEELKTELDDYVVESWTFGKAFFRRQIHDKELHNARKIRDDNNKMEAEKKLAMQRRQAQEEKAREKAEKDRKAQEWLKAAQKFAEQMQQMNRRQ